MFRQQSGEQPPSCFAKRCILFISALSVTAAAITLSLRLWGNPVTKYIYSSAGLRFSPLLRTYAGLLFQDAVMFSVTPLFDLGADRQVLYIQYIFFFFYLNCLLQSVISRCKTQCTFSTCGGFVLP